MNKNIIKALSVASAVIAVSSCRDQNFDFEDHYYQTAEQEYVHSFAEQFGAIDPSHTWNTASQNTLNLSLGLPGEYTINIYTGNPSSDDSFILAKYDKIDGSLTHELKFDAPSVLKSVYVSVELANGSHFDKKVEISPEGVCEYTLIEGQTRGTVLVNTTNGQGYVTPLGETGKLDFPKAAYDNFLEYIPEGVNNTNKAKLNTNLSFMSTGEVYKMYPMYIGGGDRGTIIGVEWSSDNGATWSTGVDLWKGEKNNTIECYQKVTVYTETRQRTETQSKAFGVWNEITPEHSAWETTSRAEVSSSQQAYGNNNTTYSNLQNNSNGNGTTEGSWSSSTNSDWTVKGNKRTRTQTQTRTVTVKEFDHSVCDGIQLEFPVGYHFRFYMKPVGGSHQGEKMYSTASSNIESKPYFASFTNSYKLDGKEVMYVGVEDRYYDSNGGGDKDLNDNAFAFVGEKMPIVIDNSTAKKNEIEYIIAYEDMGAIGDFDFNDVVLSINHLSGQENAEVKLLAAGGTLPVEVKYEARGTTTPQTIFEEVHQSFRASVSSMINTAPTSENQLVVNRSDYPNSISQQVAVGQNFSIANNADRFVIYVTYGDNDVSNAIGVPQKNDDGGTGKTPQAIVIADKNWAWPTERTNILNAYTGFNSWVGYAASDSEWYGKVWSGNGSSEGIITNPTVYPYQPQDASYKKVAATIEDQGKKATATKSQVINALNVSSISGNTTIAYLIAGRSDADTDGVSVKVELYKGTTKYQEITNTITGEVGDCDLGTITLSSSDWSTKADKVIVTITSTTNAKIESVWVK